MKLKHIDQPTFDYRKTLPEKFNGLGPDGCDGVFIEITGITGTTTNPAFLDALRRLAVDAQALDADRAGLEGGSSVKQAAADIDQIQKQQWGVLYRFCVRDWSTNIRDEHDNDLPRDEESFVYLATLPVADIQKVFEGFKDRLKLETSKDMDQDEADAKN